MARRDDVFIGSLKQAQVDHALNSLKAPKSGDSHEYGRVSGFLQGLMYAEELYLKLLQDEEEDKHK